MVDTTTLEKKLTAAERRDRRNKLRARVLKIADLLPADYTDRIVAKLPHLDSRKGRILISAIKGGDQFDEDITLALEAVVAEFIVEVNARFTQL